MAGNLWRKNLVGKDLRIPALVLSPREDFGLYMRPSH